MIFFISFMIIKFLVNGPFGRHSHIGERHQHISTDSYCITLSWNMVSVCHSLYFWSIEIFIQQYLLRIPLCYVAWLILLLNFVIIEVFFSLGTRFLHFLGIEQFVGNDEFTTELILSGKALVTLGIIIFIIYYYCFHYLLLCT